MSTSYHRLISALALLVVALSVAARPAAAAETPAEKRPRRDHFGDPLPEEALYRVGSSRFRVGDFVDFLAYSADGKTLLSINRTNSSSSPEPVVRRWEAASGVQRRQFSLPPRQGNAVALSPDGRFLAVLPRFSTEMTPIALVDAVTGRLVRSFGKQQHGAGIAFSPDGRTLTTSDNKGTICFWDPTSGKRLGTTEERSPNCWAIAFSSDGKLVTSVHADRTLRIWDRTTHRLIRRSLLTKRDAALEAVTFSPDSKLIAAYCDDAIELWNAATGERVRTLPLGSRPSLGLLAFSPDGKLLAATHVGTIRLWETNSGKEVRLLKHHRSPTGLAFSPDGKVLATSDENIYLWQVATGERIRPGGDETTEVEAAAFSPDGRTLATGGWDEFIRLWDANTGALLRRFKAAPGGNPFVSFTADGKSLVSQHHNQFALWDSVTGKEVRRFQAPASTYTVSLSPSGRTLAWVDPTRTVHFRDIASGKESRTWRREKGRRIDLHSFSSPEEIQTAIALCNAPDYAGLHRDGKYPPFHKDGQFAGFSPDGRIVARLDVTGRIHFQETATGQDLACTRLVVGLPEGRWPSLSVSAFSPDGKTFVAQLNQDPIRLWETATGKERHRLPGDIHFLQHLVFSPDGGKLLCLTSEKMALVWQVFGPSSGQRPAELSAEQLRSLWSELASDDGRTAFRALRTLTDGSPPLVVDFLRREMLASARLDPRRIARWIAELDADEFAVREKATAELKKLGIVAAGPLRQAMQNGPTPEARRRLEGLLGAMKDRLVAPETIRAWRAIEVLEHVATPEARRLLEELSKGEPEAKASLERLAQRRRAKP